MEKKKVAVFGVGRVGLPLALVLADKGFQVTGVDVDPYRISLLKHKIMPFLEEDAQPLLEKYSGNNFQIFSEQHLARIINESQIIIITLGTPIDDTYSPNFSDIEKLINTIAPFIKEGQLIIFRSTLSPGTTEQLIRQLESQTKLKVGKTLFVAYCPERIAEGHSIQELSEIPQIIGSRDEASGKKAASIFEKMTPKILFTNPTSAELAKLFCNMYRYIDFAIGNEFMMITESYNCDIYEVLDLVNKDYKRAGLKPPGFTAGPCLVKDGFFLIDKTPFMELVTAAWRLNENIPGYLLSRIKEKLKDLHNKKVAILGLAFKKNIDDTRYSLSPKLQRYFLAEGAKVATHDPYIDSQPLDETLKDADILIMGMNHDAFKKLDLRTIKELVSPDCLICDIWNLLNTGKTIFKLNEQLKINKFVPPRIKEKVSVKLGRVNGETRLRAGIKEQISDKRKGRSGKKRLRLDERRRIQVSN